MDSRRFLQREQDRQQFVENFSTNFSFGAGPINQSFAVVGTVFPLLARSALRIYNAAANVVATNAGFIAVPVGLVIQLLLFGDPTGQTPIKNANQPGQAVIVLAAANYANNQLLGGNTGNTACGLNIANDGDPLVEIRANSMVGGVGQIVRSVQFQAVFDGQNPNAAGQGFNLGGFALIDFQV